MLVCFFQRSPEVAQRQIPGSEVLLLVFCGFLNDVELFVDTFSQAEQERKNARVDEQNSAINVTQSSSPSQVCGDAQAYFSPF